MSQFGGQGTGPGQFESPAAIAVNTATGDMYVTDITNDVVEEFSASGSYISEFGGPGNGNGQFNVPLGIAVDPGSGDVYVLDNSGGFGNEDARVQKFDASGNFLLSWTFSYFEANQIAFDPATGDVWVTDDSSANQVVEFDPSGTEGSVFGSTGTGNGQFIEPTTIAADPSDRDLYVVDTTGVCRVQKFDFTSPSSFTFSFQFGSCGSGDGQFLYGGVGNNSDEIDGPAGMAVDPASGDLYAVDGGNDRVEVFDSSGDFLSASGWGVADGASQFESCTSSCQAGISGAGNGQFSNPAGDALDPSTGQLYVVDNGNDRGRDPRRRAGQHRDRLVLGGSLGVRPAGDLHRHRDRGGGAARPGGHGPVQRGQSGPRRLSRGNRNRNARLARLRERVPLSHVERVWCRAKARSPPSWVAS